MPGLVGIVNKDSMQKGLLDMMVNSIYHEPWYKINKFLEDEFAIARVHLGILNPEPQPIYNEDNSLCIFMDGEIFDYEDLKKELRQKGHKFYVNNDPEFCLHLYEEYGEKFVEKLNGSFAIAILDRENKRLLIANDRYGLRPLYYTKIGNKLLFASEVKAILEDKGFKKEINDDAVAEFFTFGQLLGSKTFFKGIEVLPPASILKWENGETVLEQYWEFGYEETAQNYTQEYYVEELVKLFKQAVERRMKGNHRIGVFLSGGMDSRAVLAAIDSPVTALTFSFPGIDKTPEFAKKVAEIKGSKHTIILMHPEFLINDAKEAVYITDGMLPLVHFLDSILLAKIKEYCDVIISGWEPETTFKGEFLNKKILVAKNDEELISILYKEYNVISKEMIPYFFSQKYYNKIKSLVYKSLKYELKRSKNKLFGNRSDCFLFQNRERRLIVPGFVYSRSKFEDREPFRDNDLIDFALKIPPELRYEHRIYFKFLRKLSPELFDVPASPTNIKIRIPKFLYKMFSSKKAATRKITGIVRIKSRGLIKIPLKSDYPDYGEWIRENKRLGKWVEDILLDERTLGRKYFNKDFIIRMVRDHMTYKKDYTQLIFLLLTFELWYRIFIEEERLA